MPFAYIVEALPRSNHRDITGLTFGVLDPDTHEVITPPYFSGTEVIDNCVGCPAVRYCAWGMSVIANSWVTGGIEIPQGRSSPPKLALPRASIDPIALKLFANALSATNPVLPGQECWQPESKLRYPADTAQLRRLIQLAKFDPHNATAREPGPNTPWYEYALARFETTHPAKITLRANLLRGLGNIMIDIIGSDSFLANYVMQRHDEQLEQSKLQDLFAWFTHVLVLRLGQLAPGKTLIYVTRNLSRALGVNIKPRNQGDYDPTDIRMHLPCRPLEQQQTIIIPVGQGPSVPREGYIHRKRFPGDEEYEL